MVEKRDINVGGSEDYTALQASRFEYRKTKQIIIVDLLDADDAHASNPVIVVLTKPPSRPYTRSDRKGWQSTPWLVWAPIRQREQYYKQQTDIFLVVRTVERPQKNDRSDAQLSATTSLCPSQAEEGDHAESGNNEAHITTDTGPGRTKKQNTVLEDDSADRVPPSKRLRHVKHSPTNQVSKHETYHPTIGEASQSCIESLLKQQNGERAAACNVLQKSKLDEAEIEDYTQEEPFQALRTSAALHDLDAERPMSSIEHEEPDARTPNDTTRSFWSREETVLSSAPEQLNYTVKPEEIKLEDHDPEGVQIAGSSSTQQVQNTTGSVTSNLRGIPDGNEDTIDLTADDEVAPDLDYRKVIVAFEEDSGLVRAKGPFRKCMSAEKLMLRAFIADVADKDTLVLRLHFGDKKWVKLERDDEDDFREKLVAPLNRRLQAAVNGGRIEITVAKGALR